MFILARFTFDTLTIYFAKDYP